MKKINKITSLVGFFTCCGVATAMILGPINPDYDANISILNQRLDTIDPAIQVTINMVRNRLEELMPQNLNDSINNGQDLFDLTSNIGTNNQQLNFNLNRQDQLETIIWNIRTMCEQGNNQLVWQAVYGRATQLLNALHNGAFGNNANVNYERLQHELYALEHINIPTAYNYLHP